MKKLNVCLLNDSFPPAIDGVANAVTNYAQIISREHGEAAVVTPFYPDADDSVYPFPVLRYPSLDTTKLVGYRAGIPFDPELMEDLERRDFDIIHSHCPIVSTMLARSLREQINRPVVFTYHTKFDIDIANAISSKLLQDEAAAILAANISACDEVWTVSRGAGDNLRKLGYAGDWRVMPNGVDFPRGRVEEDKVLAVTEGFDLPAGMPVFLFVGRMMWYKGIRIILDALNILQSEGMDFQMVFVGDGMERVQIEEYAELKGLSEKCVFTGAFRERDLLKGFYSLADLFLFPSTFDTNGIVVSEAAASSLASVLIKGSCAAEEATDGRNAFLIEEEAGSLAKLLLQLGNDKELFRKIGEKAMDDLYTSWEDSVANAWKRYPVVLENFEYKRPEIIDSRFSENLLTAAADLASGLDLVRKRNELISSRVDSFLDRWL